MAILTLTCPACQKLFSFTTHPAFDTGEDASIAEKVRTGEAFVGACPHCGHAEHYSYSFLYKERESHALLYYADRGGFPEGLRHHDGTRSIRTMGRHR